MQKIKFKDKEWDYSFKSMTWWNREKVKNAKVMVVGCGALGNEVIKNLVLMNVSNIVIVDFDEIEYSNLSRSILFDHSNVSVSSRKVDAIKSKVAQINPGVHIEAIHADICYGVGLSYFEDIDVAISCLDNRLARLFLNRHAFKFSTPWIDGAIENVSGTVKLYRKGENCYECNLSQTEKLDIKAKLACADVETQYSAQGSIPTTSISASIIGAIQVQEALKIIHGYDDELMSSSLYYEGFNNLYLNYTETMTDSACHCQYQDIEVLESSLTSEDVLERFFQELHKSYQEPDPIIILRSPLVKKVQAANQNKTTEIMIPKYRLKDFFDEDLMILEQINKIDKHFQDQSLTLHDIGIADSDIIKFLSKNGTMKFLKLNSNS